MTDYSKIEKKEIVSPRLNDYLEELIKQGVYENELYSFLVQEANDSHILNGYRFLKLTDIKQDVDTGNLHFYFNVIKEEYYDN